MKLHLPKLLLTAVMATFALVQPVWADWGENANNDDQRNTYYVTGNIDADADWKTADSASSDTTIYLRADEGGTAATIGKLTISDSDKLIITGKWDGSQNFSGLTLSSVLGDADNTLQIGGSQATAGEQIVTIGNSGNKNYTVGNTIVSAGATLKFGASNDILNFDSTDSTKQSMTVAGTLDLGTYRQTLGQGFTLTLNSGTVIGSNQKGSAGDTYGGLDLNTGKTGISIVSTGTSTISSGLRLRNNTITIDVQDGTLTIDDIVQSDNNAGHVNKTGSGKLIISAVGAYKEGIYKGNTTLSDGGTIEFAYDKKVVDGAEQVLAYGGTISGTGNLAKSGTGTMTIATVSGLSGDITVSNGALNITSLDMSGVANLSVSAGASLGITSTIDGSAANVSLNGALVLNHTGNMMSAYESMSATFSSSATSNVAAVSGYASGATYIIASGVETKGENFSIAGYENDAVSWVDGNILLQVGDTDTSTFFVNEDAAWGTDGYTDATAKTYIVAAGKTFDLKLVKSGDDFTFNSKDIVLKAGATLKNSGANAETGAKGLESLTIQGDASIDTESHIALLAGGYGATALNLNGNKLTKSGTDTFYLVNTTISAGTIEVTNGTLQVTQRNSSGTDTILTLSGGHVHVDSEKTLKVASLTGTSGSSTIKGAGTLELVGGTDASTAAKLTGAVALKVSKTGGTQTVGVASGWTGSVNAQSGSVKLVMDAGSILDRTRITKGNNATITLSGSGTYNMVGTQTTTTNEETGVTTVTDNDMNPLVSVGSDWTGTVHITNALWAKNYLDQLGNRNSTVVLEGLHGWMNKDAPYTTITTNLELINYVSGDTTKSAFIFNDHSQDVNYYFQGKVSGTGDFQVASQAGSAAHIHFEGDTSEWKGGIKITGAYSGSANTPTISINMTGGGNIFDATGNQGITMDRAGTINLNIGKADADSTMNGAIAKGDKGTLALAVKGNTTFKQNVDVSSMSVDAGKTVKLEGDVTTGSFTLGANGTLEFTGGSLTVSSSITLSTVSVDFTKYFDVNELTKTLVTAESINNWAGDVETTYNVGDVGYTATIAQVENKITLSFEEIITSKDSITTSVSTKEGWYTLSTDGTTTTLTLTVDGSLAGLAVDGSVMVNLLTDEQLSAIMSDANYKNPYVLLELTDSDKNTVAADAFNKVVFVKGETGQNYWGEMVGGQLMYNVERIPEPTTATLSLLALMGLAARRRRQK